VCEQANTVAVQIRMAADESRTSKQLCDGADDAWETPDDTNHPVLAQINDVDNVRDSRLTVAVSASKAKASTSLMSNVPQSQSKAKEVPLARRSLSTSFKENRAPASAVMPSAGHKAASATSKACDSILYSVILNHHFLLNQNFIKTHADVMA